MDTRPIAVRVGYDGGCPQSMEAVRQDGAAIRVYPSWRPGGEGVSEEATGMGVRLDVELVNRSDTPQPVELEIDWRTPEAFRRYLEYVDHVFFKHPSDADWRVTFGHIAGTSCHVRLNLQPGVTVVCQTPRYNVGDCEAFCARATTDPRVERATAGESEEGRPIPLLRVTDGNPISGKRHVVVMARNHPYESGGSFCVEGVLADLLSDAPWPACFMSRFVFHILPMTNPDGVHNGMSRLTHSRGADLNRVVTAPDKAHDALKATLDRIRPQLFVNYHCWRTKYRDGLLCRDTTLATAIQRYMPDQVAEGKRWQVETIDDILKRFNGKQPPEETKSWAPYVMERFDGLGLTLEFPWFGRTAASMRRTGARSFRAVLLAYLAEFWTPANAVAFPDDRTQPDNDGA